MERMVSSDIGIFDVIGPNMIGPSSSHTAGAARIAFLARKMVPGSIKKVEFTLYESFALTGKGHGTDKALVGGILGFLPDDLRIRDSFELAQQQGINYQFHFDIETKTLHPNTVDITIYNDSGQSVSVRGESIGGGKVQIVEINGVEIHFNGKYSAVLVVQQDLPGVVAHITKCFSDKNINIAFMKLFREDEGATAYTFVESDGQVPESIIDEIKKNVHIKEALLIQR